jgi:hypothetical protein
MPMRVFAMQQDCSRVGAIPTLSLKQKCGVSSRKFLFKHIRRFSVWRSPEESATL